MKSTTLEGGTLDGYAQYPTRNSGYSHTFITHGQLGLMGYDPAASLRQQMAGLREQLVIRTRVSPYEIPFRFVPGIPVPGIVRPAVQ